MQVTVNDLKDYLYHCYGGRGNDQGMFMKLVEEMGEVAEILNKKTGRKASSEEDLNLELGRELADMIHYIMAIAALNGLDMERIILEKDRTAAIKYGHDINLEQFIRRK